MQRRLSVFFIRQGGGGGASVPESFPVRLFFWIAFLFFASFEWQHI
jgi:hypothetical protein